MLLHSTRACLLLKRVAQTDGFFGLGAAFTVSQLESIINPLVNSSHFIVFNTGMNSKSPKESSGEGTTTASSKLSEIFKSVDAIKNNTARIAKQQNAR